MYEIHAKGKQIDKSLQSMIVTNGLRTQSKRDNPEPKACKPSDNTSGDEATPKLEPDRFDKYRSGSIDSSSSLTSMAMRTPPNEPSATAVLPVNHSNDSMEQWLSASPPDDSSKAKRPRPRSGEAIKRGHGTRPPGQISRRRPVETSAGRSLTGIPSFARAQAPKLPSFKKRKEEPQDDSDIGSIFNPDMSEIEEFLRKGVPETSAHVKAFYDQEL